MLITLPSLQPVRPTRTEAIEDEIAKFEGWLDVPSVVASGRFVEWIGARLDGLRAELAQTRRPAAHPR